MTKDFKQTTTEDRADPYKRWRYRVEQPYVLDVDQIEWRGDQPVALLELTRCDSGSVTPAYLDAIVGRYEADAQGRCARFVAAKLDIKAWIVLFTEDCTHFWVYNLTDRRGWWPLDEDQYQEWLEGF